MNTLQDDRLMATPLAIGARAAMSEALRSADLPTDDLDEANVQAFAFAGADGVVVGYGGLEMHGEHALMRSIVVEPARRGRGEGRAIVDRLLAEASARGARRVYLLTTSARAFFATLGFAVVARAEAPAAILATRQAAGLCAASAPLMVKALV